MPPKVRFQQQDIVDAAYHLARRQGLDAITARSVAAEIGCSTQPIFRVFENMDQLKQCVLAKATERFSEFIADSRQRCQSTFKSLGIAYLLYAMEEPHLFHMVFLRKHEPRLKQLDDFTCKDFVIQALMEQCCFNQEQAKSINLHMWIYTYGLAAMLATNQLKFTEKELNALLKMEYRAVVAALVCSDTEKYNPPS